jgi:hypothetical protein
LFLIDEASVVRAGDETKCALTLSNRCSSNRNVDCSMRAGSFVVEMESSLNILDESFVL